MHECMHTLVHARCTYPTTATLHTSDDNQRLNFFSRNIADVYPPDVCEPYETINRLKR